MLSLPCTAYDRILLCLFLVFLTLFWPFLSFQIHPSGTGHRKGKGYEKIKEIFKLSDDNFNVVFDEILKKADSFLSFLSNAFLA